MNLSWGAIFVSFIHKSIGMRKKVFDMWVEKSEMGKKRNLKCGWGAVGSCSKLIIEVWIVDK